MKSHVVRRGVLLAVYTGNPDVFIRTFPQVANQHSNRTRSPLHQPESKLETGKLDRKVVVKPQTSPKSQPRGSRNINDNYSVFKCSWSEGLCTCIRQEASFEPFTSDKQERDCSFTCKLFCCKCSFCHRVASKERRKSQLLLQSYKNKACERCFLCRSLEFCKYCHKCPNCCHESTCRGKATAVLGKMGSSGFESKGSHNTERGLHPLLLVQTQPNQVTNVHKQICQPTKTVQPFGGTVSADKQKCSGTGRNPKLTGVLQPAIFGTQTQQPVETYPGPEHLEHLPKHRVVQNGDPRDNKNLLTARGVGHFHRLQGRVLPHTNSQSVWEVHAFSHPGSVLPVQGPTLWSVHTTHGVHSGGQGGQTDGFTEGYKNPPVPRRLVGESHVPPNLSPAYTDLGSSLSRIRLAGEQGEVRTGPKTGFQLRRLPVRSQGGQGQTHTRTLADLNRQDTVNSVWSGVPGPAVHVPHRTSHSHRETSPPRSTSYETHTVALEKQLENTRITRKGDPCSQVAPPPPKVVARGNQCSVRSTVTPTKTCSADIYRRIKRTKKNNNWRIPESLEKVIPVPRSLHPHLRWWLEESNVLPGQPLHPLKHALQIFTDASKEVLGRSLK